MFVFDAKAVLTSAGVSFCDRNMQSDAAIPGESAEYFAAIPFDNVFHEGGIAGDMSIIAHRCAEVLATSPLPLEGMLQWICCRSNAERDTLLYLLSDTHAKWSGRVLVSDDLKVFQKEHAFVEDVTLSPEGIVFQLNPRLDRKNVKIAINAWNDKKAQVVAFRNADLPTLPDPPNKRWRAAHKLSAGQYRVQILLEDHLAFENELSLGPDLL
jgi:hypothetical protein